jgi:hypothetical protein
MIAPVPKQVIEQLFNIDIYNKKRIEKGFGEKGKFLGKDLPKRIIHGAKSIRLLNEIDRLSKQEHDVFSYITSIMGGRSYMFDAKKERLNNKFRVDAEVRELESARRKEARRGNREEVRRLSKLIAEKHKEY